jgi:hypothetical protein
MNVIGAVIVVIHLLTAEAINKCSRGCLKNRSSPPILKGIHIVLIIRTYHLGD